MHLLGRTCRSGLIFCGLYLCGISLLYWPFEEPIGEHDHQAALGEQGGGAAEGDANASTEGPPQEVPVRRGRGRPPRPPALPLVAVAEHAGGAAGGAGDAAPLVVQQAPSLNGACLV